MKDRLQGGTQYRLCSQYFVTKNNVVTQTSWLHYCWKLQHNGYVINKINGHNHWTTYKHSGKIWLSEHGEVIETQTIVYLCYIHACNTNFDPPQSFLANSAPADLSSRWRCYVNALLQTCYHSVQHSVACGCISNNINILPLHMFSYQSKITTACWVLTFMWYIHYVICKMFVSVGLKLSTLLASLFCFCFVLGSMVNGLLFHMTQPTSRSIIKAIACSKPTISEH